MQIDKRLWDRTQIGRMLTVFPGEMLQFFQNASPQSILRAEQNFSTILWRWYFLRSEIDDLSPYRYLDWRREVEKWPDRGQFVVSADMGLNKNEHSASSEPRLKIDIKADYIGFVDQPFLVDLRRFRHGTSITYDFGEKYRMEITACSKLETDDPDEIIGFYLDYCLMSWYQHNKDIMKGLTQEQWFAFWKKIIQEIMLSGRDGYNTDDLNDLFVRSMRYRLPDYGATVEEIEKKKYPLFHPRMRQWGIFWMDMAYFFLLPLSWYFSLFAPFFKDRELFFHDMKELVDHYFEQPEPLYAPCTTISLTAFGKRFFKNTNSAKNLWH